MPLISEINELPWSLKVKPNLFEARISPLIAAGGVITISDYLSTWVQQEAKRIHRDIKWIRIPILVDINQFTPIRSEHDPVVKQVVFSGSPNYYSTIEFIFKAMGLVWQKHTDCKLIITGYKTGDPATIRLRNEIIKQDIAGKVCLVGYLSRAELLQTYANYDALLIPLLNDLGHTQDSQLKLVSI